VLAAAEVSIRDYWSTGLPEVYGKPFHDLAGGFQPKSPSSRPWKCHGQNLTYDNIKGNAFYCGGQGDDYIAYDAAFLLPRLNKTFGALAPAVVLAHEMGHAIQARAGTARVRHVHERRCRQRRRPSGRER
jgi:predicted metalloprotease